MPFKLKGEISEIPKIHWQKKKSSPKQRTNFSQTCHKIPLGKWNSILQKIKGQCLYKNKWGGGNSDLLKWKGHAL